MEIWKDIKGYENLYKISNYGKIKSLHNKERYLKLSKDSNGYIVVGLYKNGIKKYFKLHRLVANTFINNPNNYPHINHKDENKSNNKFDNLEWCSCKYNNNYGNRTNKVRNKLSKKVYQYDMNDKLIKIWNSLQDIKISGYNISKICEVCNHKYTTNYIYGFKWKYEQDVDIVVDLLNNI